MQSKVPDLAGQVADDASKMAGAAISIGLQGVITTTLIAEQAAQIPGDAVQMMLQHFRAALEIVDHYVQHGEAPK